MVTRQVNIMLPEPLHWFLKNYVNTLTGSASSQGFIVAAIVEKLRRDRASVLDLCEESVAQLEADGWPSRLGDEDWSVLSALADVPAHTREILGDLTIALMDATGLASDVIIDALETLESHGIHLRPPAARA